MNLFSSNKKMFVSRAEARRKRRRRRLGVLLVALVLLGGVAYLWNSLAGDAPGAESAAAEGPGISEANPLQRGDEAEASPPEPPQEEPPPPPKTPEAAAYLAVAPELPGITPQSLNAVYRSRLNPSWASVHVAAPEGGRPFVVFAHEGNGGVWEAKKSLRADEPDYAKNEVVPLAEVPRDLVQYIYPENAFVADVPAPRQETVDRAGLPEVGSAEFASTEPVVDGMEGASDAERERVEGALGNVREKVEGYDGVGGVYVYDLEGDFGYGVRPNETFFSASIIKVPVMVAVYRRVDEGKLSFSQQVEIKEEDWAAGAGWLQWEPAGTQQTVGDLLLLMMTQSDNVATNALIRMVGGPGHVNEVARSMGAEDTLLYQKVSSERAAVPQLDNRTTPKDMATMMREIAEGDAASEKSCGYMIDLMRLNELDWWLDEGLPDDVNAANKAGWLYAAYDDAGIVQAGERPYVVAILSKHGPKDVNVGSLLIQETSKTVWDSQSQPPPDDSDGDDSGDEPQENGSDA